jgi:hypothetical protein
MNVLSADSAHRPVVFGRDPLAVSLCPKPYPIWPQAYPITKLQTTKTSPNSARLICVIRFLLLVKLLGWLVVSYRFHLPQPTVLDVIPVSDSPQRRITSYPTIDEREPADGHEVVRFDLDCDGGRNNRRRPMGRPWFRHCRHVLSHLLDRLTAEWKIRAAVSTVALCCKSCKDCTYAHRHALRTVPQSPCPEQKNAFP